MVGSWTKLDPCSGVHGIYVTRPSLPPTSQAPIYLFFAAHFNTIVVHVTLGSIVERPRQEGETSIFGPNLFVPTIYLNVGYKGGGQIWTIRREGVTSRQVSPPADDSGVLCVASDEPFLTCTITFASALSAVTYVCSVSAVPAVP